MVVCCVWGFRMVGSDASLDGHSSELTLDESIKSLRIMDLSEGPGLLVVLSGRQAPEIYQLAVSDLNQIERRWTLPSDDIATSNIAVIGDGVFLRTGMSGDIDIIGLDVGTISSEHAHDAPILSLAVSHDRKLAVTGGANGTVLLWRIDNGEVHADAVIAQFGFPILAMVLDEPNNRVIIGQSDGNLTSVRLSDRAGGAGPPKPSRLFVFNQESQQPGAKLFNACVSCHSTGYHREGKMGPPFGGLFGRRAGTVEHYPYSTALIESEVVWNEVTLSELFALGPENYLPGTTMPLQLMPKDADRDALINYMKVVIEQ